MFEAFYLKHYLVTIYHLSVSSLSIVDIQSALLLQTIRRQKKVTYLVIDVNVSLCNESLISNRIIGNFFCSTVMFSTINNPSIYSAELQYFFKSDVKMK